MKWIDNLAQFSPIDIEAEIARYFDDSSKPAAHVAPKIVLIMGGPASGKTRLRKERFAEGHVLVDAADIFINLSKDGCFDFPGEFDMPLNQVGGRVAMRAIAERRNIVTEIIGADFEGTCGLIEAMRSVGYQVEAVALTCDIEVAVERNMARGENNISSYFAEPYQHAWLTKAAQFLSESSAVRADLN